MSFPQDQPVIDLMMAIPGGSTLAAPRAIPAVRNRAEYFRAIERLADELFRRGSEGGPPGRWAADFVIDQMDRFNVHYALVGFEETGGDEDVRRRHGDRFLFETAANPHAGMEEVRRVRRLHGEGIISAVSVFAAGVAPDLSISDKKLYPIYAACCELGLPVFIDIGAAGSQACDAARQAVLLDEVCAFFPELNVVMRNGFESWDDLAVKLMMKWPNLHHSTSAVATKPYPKAIVDYANSCGADRILYAGCSPLELSLDQIFHELPEVPLNPDVWPKFLHDNAARLFGLGS